MIFSVIKKIAFAGLFLSLLLSCDENRKKSNVIAAKQTILDTAQTAIIIEDTVVNTVVIDTIIKKADSIPLKTPVFAPKTDALALVAFAKTLLKTPYVYGGKDPQTGFDNAGFISYVFNHFGVVVPTSTASFSNVGRPIPLTEASAGDLILFSRSDSTKKVIGYIGITTTEKGMPIEFIYATSGKVKGVTISPLNSYYQKRLIAVRSLFK
ncbi:C40 family peptidase [Pedobacter cryophilus]|uniref:NlpC/P60 family protein n=1 Tax=Pedobacter cryophilus TaxID=2571271 RepID=A0A4U1C091_9SPHI|nr:C40 family peptidase [Pedobacter cryophilus]TKB98968.1 NlpC/P60 family protein [Pedobacter cryophilus]